MKTLIKKRKKNKKRSAISMAVLKKHHHLKLLESLFHLYLDNARIVRFWFVAYGVGGPALILANEPILNHLKFWRIRLMIGSYLTIDWNMSFAIAMCFLTGAVLQVIIAMLNKWAVWCRYFAEAGCNGKKIKQHVLYRWSIRFSNEFITDIIVDILTVILFGIATGFMTWCITH